MRQYSIIPLEVKERGVYINHYSKHKFDTFEINDIRRFILITQT